jgi:hypothetical protein
MAKTPIKLSRNIPAKCGWYGGYLYSEIQLGLLCLLLKGEWIGCTKKLGSQKPPISDGREITEIVKKRLISGIIH